MSKGPRIITRELLELLLQELAISEDTERTVIMAGGNAMLMLYGNVRDPTGDVDLIQAPDSPPIATLETIAKIRADYGLGDDWYDGLLEVWGLVPDARNRFFMESEPAEDIVTPRGTLHVRTTKKPFLVALKMHAGRDVDIIDLGILARDLGLTRPEELLDMFESQLPHLFISQDKGVLMQTAIKALRG